jgi:hypothetical protein
MTRAAGGDLFSAADAVQLERRGLDLEEAYRQIALLARPEAHLALERPCTRGDGIEVLTDDEAERLRPIAARAAEAGRCAAFVPASGAATRMFADLLLILDRGRPLDPRSLDQDLRAGRPEARVLRAFLEGIARFAFDESLARELARTGLDRAGLIARGEYGTLLEALLTPAGLGLAETPKALVPFHRTAGGVRTAFEEHLVEAATLLADATRRCRVHFTVAHEHLDRFLERLERTRPSLEARCGVRFDAEFSVQKASSETLALDESGRPFRGADRTLLFRPAGHGALLENLQDLDAEFAFIKNVDNVAVDAMKDATIAWNRALTGKLIETQAAIFALLARLEDARDLDAPEDALAFAREKLHAVPPPESASSGHRRGEAVRLLDRPLRVCGMVPNTGEPGGGPFWVRGRDGGTSLQVVESAQVDGAEAAQREALARSTHFNPVFLACALRDRRGEAFDLRRFVDPEAVIVTKKSHEGRELMTLERPGLWNGAMARWSTIFVEVPLAVFNPVKTVLDLLRPEHQGGG